MKSSGFPPGPSQGLKKFLAFSVFINVVLAGLTVWLAQEKRVVSGGPPACPPAISALAEDRKAHPAASERRSASPAAGPFNWSQIESTDYRTYVANLRGVGCPEQTVRDIITADVDSVYVPRRQKWEGDAAEGFAARQRAEAELAGLRQEETSVLATLLGGTSALRQRVDRTSVLDLARHNVRSVMPLVFAGIDPATLQLDAAQIAVVDQVREQFQREIGVQDPNDPAYRQRWNAAQRRADDTLRGMLGSKVYIQYQVQGANQVSRTGDAQ